MCKAALCNSVGGKDMVHFSGVPCFLPSFLQSALGLVQISSVKRVLCKSKICVPRKSFVIPSVCKGRALHWKDFAIRSSVGIAKQSFAQELYILPPRRDVRISTVPSPPSCNCTGNANSPVLPASLQLRRTSDPRFAKGVLICYANLPLTPC